jgi:hypothetical protein
MAEVFHTEETGRGKLAMDKRYIVTVVECGEEIATIGKDWKQIGDDGKYGYTPEIEGKREYSRKVYEQTLNTLDLPALVSVVNKV